jgi:serine protease Do
MARPGDKVKLDVLRQGKKIEVAATLGASQDKVASADGRGGAAADGGKLGLALRPLDRDEQREFGGKGLVVEDVAGAAQRAGVEPGDVVIAINGTPATSLEQVRGIVEKAGKSVALLIQRGDGRIFVPIRIG